VRNRSLSVLRFVLPCLLFANCLATNSPTIDSSIAAQRNVHVTVTPASAYLRSSQSVTFHAVVSGTQAQNVRWSVTQGTITQAGAYTANGSGTATITAAWSHNRRMKGTAVVAIIAPPVTYSTARTDENVEQLPSTMPAWGGLSGVSAKWCNPAFANLCTIRATDGQTALLSRQATLQTADSGEMALWAVDSWHLIVKGTGGAKYVIGFNPATELVTRTALTFGYDAVLFSRTDPQTMYALDKTKVHVIQAASDWSGVSSDALLFDFASCLPEGFRVTWNGTFGAVLGDNSFRAAFSNTLGQGSGVYMAAYQTEAIGSVGPGCYVLNTQEGTVTGPNGYLGSVDDGVSPLADRFTMHEGGGGQNPQYSLVSYSVHQPKGASGCLAGDCRANNPYVWEIGTTHLRTCPIQCDGHSAKGYNYWAMGKKYRLHRYLDPKAPLTPLVNFPADFPDQHGSWINTTQDDAPPAFLVSTDVTPIIPYPTWGYNEVLAVASDGSQKAWRFGQTLNSGKSIYFIVQNAIGVVSQDGRWVAFTSDMCGAECPVPAPLGYEKDGKTPRGDVFIMEAK
jgi:hypothetical protein